MVRDVRRGWAGSYGGWMTASPLTPLTTPSGTVSIPQLGFGVFQVDDDGVVAPVTAALEAGYRHIDTAKVYGNEAGVGRALADSPVAREDVFVTTKLWNADQGDHGTARAALTGSLERLGLEQADLYLIHWPMPSVDRYVQSWQALRTLRDEGLTRAIGVCNFDIEHLQRLHDETGEWPAINQVELHPYLAQAELRAFHEEHGIVTEAWAPIGQGSGLLDDEVIAQVAAKHGITPAQAVIAWHLAIGNVVIPKSVTPSRIVENHASLDVRLDKDDVAAISGLDRGGRIGPVPADFAYDAPGS